VIVGHWRPDDVDVPALVARLGLNERRALHRFRSNTLEDFLGWLAAVDVVVNLRYPTVGETSAVALRALAAGRAVRRIRPRLVRRTTLRCLCEAAASRRRALARSMTILASDPELRAELGARGKRMRGTSHSPAAAARAYVDFAQVVLARAAERFR
jgi:hypothetical protein